VRFPAFFQHAYYKGLKNDMLAYSVSNFVHELISVGCIYIYLNGENKLHKMNCFNHNDYRQRKECCKSAKRVRDNVPYWPLSRQRRVAIDSTLLLCIIIINTIKIWLSIHFNLFFYSR